MKLRPRSTITSHGCPSFHFEPQRLPQAVQFGQVLERLCQCPDSAVSDGVLGHAKSQRGNSRGITSFSLSRTHFLKLMLLLNPEEEANQTKAFIRRHWAFSGLHSLPLKRNV